MLTWISLVALSLVLVSGILLVTGRGPLRKDRDGHGASKPSDKALYAMVADEVGLEVVHDERGRPGLRGCVDGVDIEVDQRNHVGAGTRMLGLRFSLPELESSADVAIWSGPAPEVFTSTYGRPSLLGTGDAALFDVYARLESGRPLWWRNPRLTRTLVSLPGAGLWKHEARVTVFFARLDAESIRTALQVPGILVDAFTRPTIH